MSQAYAQLSLDEDSKAITTINTPRGLFQYNRLCYGISSAPGIFQRTMDQLLKDIPGVLVFLDDVLISGKDVEEHNLRVDKVLTRLEKAGVRLQGEKCRWSLPSISYLGFRIDQEGIHPTQDKLDAISKAPVPQNVPQVQAYLGLLNFYRKFLPNASTLLEPLTKLLRANERWRWESEQQSAFQLSKEALLKSDFLVHFDPALPITVTADSSSYGVGAVISQTVNGQQRPVCFASRTLNAAERNYSQLEREALALVFAIKRFHFYLFGHSFTLITDHKPLLGLFSPEKAISPLASGRIQRWSLILQSYKFTLIHKSGKLLGNADALSRLPAPEKELAVPVPAEWINLVNFMNHTPVTAELVAKETSTDPTLAQVMKLCHSGWSVESQNNPCLIPYQRRESELSLQSGCILWGRRVIIPNSLRNTLLEELHVSHPGVSRMKELARSYIWWPGLDADIEQFVLNCSSCLSIRASPKSSPLHPWEWPSNPWYRVHVDYAGPVDGTYYIVIVDAYSKWVEIFSTTSTSSASTISILRTCFARFGLPVVLVSDNGTSFTSTEFQSFMTENGIRHVTSAPYHPATNGLAENMVKSLKRALSHSEGRGSRKAVDQFLLRYRITPHTTTGKSPAELMFGRKVRTVFDLLNPEDALRIKVQNKQEKQKYYHDPKHPRNLDLVPQTQVMVRNYSTNTPKWIPADIVDRSGPVSYRCQTSEGGIMRRHSDQILERTKLTNQKTPLPEEKESTPEHQFIITETNPASPKSALRRSSRAIKPPVRLNL